MPVHRRQMHDDVALPDKLAQCLLRLEEIIFERNPDIFGRLQSEYIVQIAAHETGLSGNTDA